MSENPIGQKEPETELECLKSMLDCLERIESKLDDVISSLNSINEFGVTARDPR